jgi:hypothetical protein
MTLRNGFAFTVAGIIWGGLAYLIGSGVYGSAVWVGVLAGPLIGLAAGSIMQGRFESGTTGRRWLVALGTLYLGATLFGTTIGIYSWATRSAGARSLESFLEGPASAWYGTTLLVLLLWPLAYFTHYLIEHWSV